MLTKIFLLLETYSPFREPILETTAPRFVKELRPEEIRWFYKKTMQDKTWQPLSGRDSIVIERAYRRRLELEKAAGIDQQKAESSSESASHLASDQSEDTEQKVVAFGGLYRLIYATAETPESPVKATQSSAVDKSKEKRVYRLKPIYWEGTDLFLTRGTWFFEAAAGDWQPLDADSAEFVQKVESKHLNIFANQRIPDRSVYFEKGPRPILCEVLDADEEKSAGSGATARWHSVVDVLLINNSRSSRLWRYLKLTGAGTKLRRGYHNEASMDDGPAPVTRLLFVIHGIGQKRQRNKIVTNTTSMREIAEQLLRSNHSNVDGRPMFLPVDWRAELQIDEDLISSITPNYLEQIRGFFNETILDLLYYASPIYGPAVIRGMCTVLNRMYRLYLSNDPEFEARGGRVCLVAHSLGSVITYDILTGGGFGKNSELGSDPARLVFPVDHLFCFGSPLGVFLAARHLRGLRILQSLDEDLTPDGSSAKRFQLHNVYHPADPVAYRVEPLISDIYTCVRPLRIHRYNSVDHSPYDSMQPEVQEVKPIPRSRAPSSENIAKGETQPVVRLSDSEDNLSGFESDDGRSAASAVRKIENLQTSSPSPPPKRSWSAAVFSRLGMAKAEKENVAPRAASPVVATVVDGEQRSDSPEVGVVFTKAVEEAKEASEVQHVSRPKATCENGEKGPATAKKKDVMTIPSDEALPYRVDFALRPGRMDYAYWAAIVSHISYWSNHDAVQYVLSALYGPPGSHNTSGSV